MEEKTHEMERERERNCHLRHRGSGQGLMLQAAVWSNSREPIIHFGKQPRPILTGVSWMWSSSFSPLLSYYLPLDTVSVSCSVCVKWMCFVRNYLTNLAHLLVSVSFCSIKHYLPLLWNLLLIVCQTIVWHFYIYIQESVYATSLPMFLFSP